METAQLGQQPAISLGGYIPAPQKNRIGQEIAMQLLAGMLGDVGKNVVSRVMTPDSRNVAAEAGVNLDKPKWYQRQYTPQEIQGYTEGAQLNNYRTGNLMNDVARNKDIATNEAAQRDIAAREATMREKEGAARIGNLNASTDATRTNTAILPYTTAVDLERGMAQTNNLSLQGQTEAAMLPYQVAGARAQAGTTQAQGDLLRQQVAAGKNPMDAMMRQQQWLQTSKAQMLSSMGEKMGQDASKRGKQISQDFDDFVMRNPPTGDLNQWYSQLQQYVMKRNR